MNMIRRDEADDTGEQDVRDLRRIFGEGEAVSPTRSLMDVGPYVRHKEDVPHEDAIPDLYGLDNTSERDEVEETLLQMVEEGELCFGWLEDRGEFGFWHCDDLEGSQYCPTSEPDGPQSACKPEPVPERVSRRRPKRPLARKILLGVAASITAPFAIGVVAYAAEQGEYQGGQSQPIGRPDLTSDDIPEQHSAADAGNTASYQPLDTSRTPSPAPSRVKHAKPSTQQETPKAPISTGKHAKKSVSKGPSALPTGIPTIKVKLPSSVPSPTAAQVKRPDPVGSLVKSILAPVGALFGN